MRSEALRRYLADGPATWRSIADEFGWSVNRAMVEVKKLEYDGCVVKVTHVSIIELVADEKRPAARTCAWPNCRTPLRSTNATGYCGAHVQGAALARWSVLSAEQRREIAEEVCADYGAASMLFDTQLSLEGGTVGA